MRLIVDTDTAGDDVFSLLLALRTPGVDLEAVTICVGNVAFDQQVENALYTIEVAGRAGDVAVYRGADRPLLREWVDAAYVHGSDGMGESGFPRARQRPAPGHAVDVIVRTVMESPGEVTILAQAPLTNVALAYLREPGIARATKHLFVMGGTNNGIGNVTPAAEYNFYVDPEAACIVLGAGFDVTLVDWNLCRRDGLFTHDQLAAIEALDTPLARFFGAVNRKVLEYCVSIGMPGSTHPDLLACAIALDAAVVLRSDRVAVDVETRGELTRGYCLVDSLHETDREPNVRLVEEADGDLVFERFLDVLR